MQGALEILKPSDSVYTTHQSFWGNTEHFVAQLLQTQEIKSQEH